MCEQVSFAPPSLSCQQIFFWNTGVLKNFFFFFCYKGAQPQVCIYSFILSSQISIEQSELITYRIKKKKEVWYE